MEDEKLQCQMSGFCFMNTSNGNLINLNTEGKWPSYILTNKRDCIPEHIKLNGSWELDLITEASKFIKDDSIVLDIGANIGVWSVSMAQNKSVTVHSFEPYPPTYYNLCTNILINQSYNVHTYRSALSNVEDYGKTLNLYTLNGNIGATRLSSDPNFSQSNYTTSIDYLDRLFPTETVSFIKIDVEGYEENVLKGGKDLIQRSKPVIYFEAWSSHRESLIKYLNSVGYNVEHIKHDDFRAIPKP